MLKIKQIKLHVINMKLKNKFKTSHGVYDNRKTIVVEIIDYDGVTGWGEVVAFEHPWYTEETVASCLTVIKEILAPIMLSNNFTHPSDLVGLFDKYKRNNMAKAGLENALWDVYAKKQSKPLREILGGVRSWIEVGVAIGILPLPDLIKKVEQNLEFGYKRIKLKIDKNSLNNIAELRKLFPDAPLMVDANSSFTLDDVDFLRELDDLNLIMIEQPLKDNDFLEHSKLQKLIKTSICLDESIHSLEDAELSHHLRSARIISIKQGRVGGLHNAIKIHNYCLKNRIPVWCGGMLETGIGRAHNIALATLENFVIPGDISASANYWESDIIEPEIVVHNGIIKCSNATGIGYEINRKQLEKVTEKSYFL
ncbi:MAG: O-succinylbenzoate synthase [Bacillales bacterium]|jgi:O-succinylbenzoate synthase|nr:O-succinylbenzoate synthase [Bacillales bacterium]